MTLTATPFCAWALSPFCEFVWTITPTKYPSDCYYSQRDGTESINNRKNAGARKSFGGGHGPFRDPKTAKAERPGKEYVSPEEFPFASTKQGGTGCEFDNHYTDLGFSSSCRKGQSCILSSWHRRDRRVGLSIISIMRNELIPATVKARRAGSKLQAGMGHVGKNISHMHVCFFHC